MKKDAHRFFLAGWGHTKNYEVQSGAIWFEFKHHLSKYTDVPVIRELQSNIFMDDWISGADNPHEINVKSCAKLMLEA